MIKRYSVPLPKIQRNSIFFLSVLIFLVNILIKCLFISSISPVITYDELYYLGEAQSVVTSVTDTTGTWRPWNLAPAHPMYDELTGTTQALGFILFPHNSFFSFRVVPLLMGSLLPVLLGLIVYRITNRKLAFVLTAVIATTNPWIFQFSKMGFDSLFSIFFYNVGIVLLLYMRGWRKLWALLPFFWGFFQYQGHKPLLVPIVLLCLIFIFLEDKKKTIAKTLTQPAVMSHIVVLILSLVLTVTYLIRLPHLASSQRSSEFSLLGQQQLAEDVNVERQLTLNNPLIKMFENKYTHVFEGMIVRFITSFDLTALFIKGNDAVDTYTVTNYGFLHLLDAVLIIAGTVYLVTNKKLRAGAIFIFGYILIGTIPNVLRLGLPWITFRGSFVILGLILLAGMGAFYLLIDKSKKWQTILIGIYLASTVFFFFIYFFQFPITATRSSYFFDRVLASYVKRNSDKSLLIIADQPRATLESIITYNDLLTKETSSQLYETTTQLNMKFQNLTILNDCANKPFIQSSTSSAVIAVDYRKEPCGISGLKAIEISSPIDSGTKYYIYNDSFCKQYSLPYYTDIKTNKFNIESLSDQEFCQTFFTDKN